MSDKVQAKIAEIRGRSPFGLAGDGDAAGPDTLDSAGAVFLLQVAHEVCEAAEEWLAGGTRPADVCDASDKWAVIADVMPDVYTGMRWAEFVDLAAWSEDVEEYTTGGEDMTDLAGLALYVIAERLCGVLWDEIVEADSEDSAGGGESEG
jgi:hypothetical protein